MRNIKTIVLEDAKKAIKNMEKKCLEFKIECSFCVIDCMGNILILEKMDNASAATLDIAKEKALTALRVIMSTKKIDELIRKDKIEIEYFAGTCKTAFWGGLPLFEDKNSRIPVGSIGVSGGSWEQDEAVSKTGVEAINLTTK